MLSAWGNDFLEQRKGNYSQTYVRVIWLNCNVICCKGRLIGDSDSARVSKQYEGVSKSFRTGQLEPELQMVQLSATRCSCIAILWVSLTSFAAVTPCVASQRVFIIVIIYFVIDSVREILDTATYYEMETEIDSCITVKWGDQKTRIF
jgi:hypothetical protein